jgi:hypothetical protein
MMGVGGGGDADAEASAADDAPPSCCEEENWRGEPEPVDPALDDEREPAVTLALAAASDRPPAVADRDKEPRLLEGAEEREEGPETVMDTGGGRWPDEAAAAAAAAASSSVGSVAEIIILLKLDGSTLLMLEK